MEFGQFILRRNIENVANRAGMVFIKSLKVF